MAMPDNAIRRRVRARPIVKVSNRDRERLIAARDNDGDVGALADNLQIPRHNAYFIADSGRCEQLPKGGKRFEIMTDEQLQFVIGLIEDNASLTLQQLRDRLIVHFVDARRHPSTSTISRRLHNALITVKKIETVPFERNSAITIQRRMEYATWWDSPEGPPANPETLFVYCDEAGYNLHTRRNFGRSRRGSVARRVLTGGPGPNITVIAAICDFFHHGHPIFYEISDGGTTRQKFDVWFARLQAWCVENFGLNQTICFIFDNASCHNNARDNQCDHALFRTKSLPPWSPFLNPIEECFSKCKATTKRFLAEQQMELAQPRPYGEQGAFRRGILRQGIQIGMESITGRDAVGWTRHSAAHIPQCRNGELM